MPVKTGIQGWDVAAGEYQTLDSGVRRNDEREAPSSWRMFRFEFCIEESLTQ
jgi:hypothetical protein